MSHFLVLLLHFQTDIVFIAMKYSMKIINPLKISQTVPFFVCLLLFALVTPGQLQAQDEEVTDSTAWVTDLKAILAGSQASYNNWQEGGINSLAFTASLEGAASRTTEHWIQKHEGRFAIGALKQDTLDVRKADDIISLSSTFQYKNDTNFAKFQPTLSLTLRTQFADGFDYSTSPETKVSSFFSPAVLTQTLGLTYQPEPWFSWLVGVSAKETVVGEEAFREIYGNAIDETVRFEPGYDTTIKFDKDIVENVRLKSGLNVFGAFGNIDQPDVRWENLLTMTVNSWLTVNLEFVTFYDLDIDDRVQLKQVLSTGVSFSLL